MKRLLFFLLVIPVLAGCSWKKSLIVDHYLTSVLRNEAAYPLPGVTNYVLKSYDIEDVKDEFVIVKMTFALQNGGDMVETVRLKVRGTHVYSTDRTEINRVIRNNLGAIKDIPQIQSWLSYVSGQPIGVITPISETGVKLDLLKQFTQTHSINGEDYSKIKFVSHNVMGYLVGPFRRVDPCVVDQDGYLISESGVDVSSYLRDE